MIEGPWGEPRIYPDMQGILDNPDAAYAKLRELGKGLFGPDGAGLGAALGGTARRRLAQGAGGRTRRQPASRAICSAAQLGETIGNLLQQGLSGGLGGAGQGRNQPGRKSRQARARRGRAASAAFRSPRGPARMSLPPPAAPAAQSDRPAGRTASP